MMKKRFIPQAWKEQWAKPMFTLVNYLPVKYEANERKWQERRFIWDFKDGKNSRGTAAIVAKKMRGMFGAEVSGVTLACIPASTTEKNEARYKLFCEEVARLTGCETAYHAITLEGGRMAIHETQAGKRLTDTQVIRFDEPFFQGRRILVFDDVLTKGHSYARFACALERMGASVVGAFFLGRTICGQG